MCQQVFRSRLGERRLTLVKGLVYPSLVFAWIVMVEGIVMRYGLWVWPVATLLMVTACSSTEWVHRYKPKSQLNNEYTSCEREVFKNFAAMPLGDFTPYIQGQRIDACLKQRGWVQREVE